MQFNPNFRTRNKNHCEKISKIQKLAKKRPSWGRSDHESCGICLIYNRLKFKLYISLSNFNDNVAYAHHVISCFWSSREKSSKILKETSNFFFFAFWFIIPYLSL